MRELSISTEEEVDLLIKYLGPESTKQANNIKIANFSNPGSGLSRIWERLNDKLWVSRNGGFRPQAETR